MCSLKFGQAASINGRHALRFNMLQHAVKLSVTCSHLEQSCVVTQLSCMVCIERGAVAFLHTPEEKTLRSEFVSDFHRLLDLSASVTDNLSI